MNPQPKPARPRPAKPRKHKPTKPACEQAPAMTTHQLRLHSCLVGGALFGLDDVPDDEFKPALVALLNASSSTESSKRPWTLDDDDRIFRHVFCRLIRDDFQLQSIEARSTHYLKHLANVAAAAADTEKENTDD